MQAIGAGLDRVTLDGCAQIFRPTVVASPNFSAERDSETLRKSMKGAGETIGAMIVSEFLSREGPC